MSVIEVKLRIKKATMNYLKITDKNLNVSFHIKRVRKKKEASEGGEKKSVEEIRYVLKVIRPPDKLYKTSLSELREDLILKYIKEIGLKYNDQFLCDGAELLTNELMKLIKEWRDRAEVDDLIQELSQGEGLEDGEPILTLRTERGVIKVIGGDGLKIPLHGGFISLGSKYAVVETTYAYGRVRKEVRKGIIEVDDVVPVMFIGEYEDGKLVGRKAAYPEKKVEVFGKPICVESRSRAKTILTTLMSVRNGKKFVDGTTAKSYNELFSEVVEVVKQYVNIDWNPRLYDLIGVFIISTYFYDMFTTFPRVYIVGPFGSGKTRLGLLIAYASRHGFPIIDPSNASVYRAIEAYGPTIYIDESKISGDLDKILSAGYKKGIQVPRVDKTAKDEFIVTLHNTYTPVVFGFVEPPNERLLQRSIIVNMLKAPDPNPEKKDPEPEGLEWLREELYLARLTRANEVIESMKIVKDIISDSFVGREFELWYPLLTIAKLCSDEVFNNLLSLAREDIEKRKSELWSEEKLILAGIETIFKEEEKDEITFMTSYLREKIKKILINEGEFNEKEFEKLWSKVRLGIILSRIGIMRDKKDKGKNARRVRKITKKQFIDLCLRYGYESDLLNKDQVGKVSEEVENKNLISLSPSSPTYEELKSSYTHSEKLTDLTDLTDSSLRIQNLMIENEVGQVSFSNLTQSEKLTKFGIINLIRELLRDSPKSDIEIYEELVKAQRKGLLKDGIVVNYDLVSKALKTLEDEGVVGRVRDALCDPPILWMGLCNVGEGLAETTNDAVLWMREIQRISGRLYYAYEALPAVTHFLVASAVVGSVLIVVSIVPIVKARRRERRPNSSM